MTRLLPWIRARDPGLAALRRAGRAAILMPAMFALGVKVIGIPTIATFAAFACFALLLLVDFTGPMRDRLFAQGSLSFVTLGFVAFGTLASRSPWLGAAAMAVVGFCVLFAGVVSSVLASATVALLLPFTLAVSVPGPVSSIQDRMEGWALGAGAAFLGVALLWPRPGGFPLRGVAVTACRALAARLRADAQFLRSGDDEARVARDVAIEEAATAMATLQRVFFATPYRPTGLTSTTRLVVRLIDELGWLDSLLAQTPPHPVAVPEHERVCAVKTSAAVVLDRGADLLESGSPGTLAKELDQLRASLAQVESTNVVVLPERADDDEIVTALDPAFRAQELAFVVSQIGANIDLAAASERRPWLDRLLGRQPAGVTTTLSAAQERAASHFERHSVWLHNSLRGAAGLAIAVFIANESGVQHSFWVVLGTLSVLRSNALNTGQNALRSLAGTIAGFVIGGGLLVLVGTNTTVLWLLLPIAVLLAGFAPAAISFAAGQAAFTLALEILYNIVAPAGWQVGLVRVEDIAIGCAVSLAVGLLFWPRGAGAALGQALAEGYADSARYLAAAVEFAVSRCDHGIPSRPAPTDETRRAAGAARRLDDAFRSYLAEQGAKPVPLADVTALVTGVAGLRLAADAVLHLWRNEDHQQAGDRSAARTELLRSADSLAAWYRDLAASLIRSADVPEPLARTGGGLVDAVRRDLSSSDGRTSDVGARIIWTGDHLDAARRLQPALVGPAREIYAVS